MDNQLQNSLAEFLVGFTLPLLLNQFQAVSLFQVKNSVCTECTGDWKQVNRII